MGDSKPTTRTLSSGEKATHFPDGRVVLQPHNSLADVLDANHEDQQAASNALRDTLVDAATTKREALAGGSPVPSEKRAV